MPSYPGVKANRSRGETFQDGWSANLPPQKLSSEGFIYTEISTSSCLVIAGILLTVFSMYMVPGCASAPTNNCPGPDYIKQDNGFCCGVVSCAKNFTVSMCKVHHGNDTCAPCPEGSFLLDATTSITATSCVKPDCLKNRTRPSLVKSTTIDPYACPQWCQCDISFNYCGTDPCNCRRGTCPYRTNLHQDCGCRLSTPSPPKPTLPKEIPVTQRNFTTSKRRIYGSTFPPGTTNASDSQPKQSHDKAVAAVVAVVAVAVVILIVIWCKWKQRGNNISGNRNRGADGASEDPAGFPLILGTETDVNMDSNQDIPEEAIDLHNNMVKHLDGYIFGDDLIRLKELFKDIPLTPAVMEKISNIYDLFKHLLDNKIISIGSYTKFISNLRQINPNQAAYVEKQERDMQEVIKRGPPGHPFLIGEG
ncbi:uncharacterized protein LOC110458880, partial [Mizuhopecten yessoensis]|uniref:uncharacterized protein LOC110458880 n=1 Tax=Mizuhopecten yessoensis TaxID=6573 RepID=UPI000B45DFDF